MIYKVTITEYLKKTVEVEADNEEEAKSKVENDYASCEIILDSSDFADFKMEVKRA